MAILNLSVTIPDEDVKRVHAAIRASFGVMTNGVNSLKDAKEDDVVERLRQDIIQTIRGMVISYERREAITAAEKLDPVVDVT